MGEKAGGAAGAGEKVGGIYYEVTLDTQKLIDGQRQVDTAVGRSAISLDRFEAKLSQVAQAVGVYAAALYAISQSDAFTKLESQIKLASDSASDFAAGMASVKAIAQEAQVSLSGVGTLFARVSNASKELGISQQRVSDITRAVALSLKISGAGAQEAASATLQLSQAFASGVLRGEEFNAVSEASPRLMKALADGIGRPIGELRALAEQGLLTSEVLAAALPRALPDLEQEAAQIRTISGAFQELQNEVMLLVGEGAKTSGAAKTIADAIGAVASNLDLLTAAAMGYAATQLARIFLDVGTSAAAQTRAVFETVGAMQASRAAAIAETKARVDQMAASNAALVISRAEMVAKLASANAALVAANAQAAAARSAGALSFAITALQEAELAATVATKARSAALAELAILGQQQARVTAAMTAAQAAHTAAITATGTAATIAGRALSFMGGPIGVITNLLGLGVTAWMLWGGSAGDGEKKAAEAVKKSHVDIVKVLDEQIAKLKERNRLADSGLPGVGSEETDATRRLIELQSQIEDLQTKKGVGAKLPEAARLDLLGKLVSQYGELAEKVRTVDELKAGSPSAKAQEAEIEYLKRYGTEAQKAQIAIDEFRKKGLQLTPEREKAIRDGFKDKSRNSGGAESYLEDLKGKAAKTEIGRANSEADEALSRNRKMLADGLLTKKQAAQAEVLIDQRKQNALAAIAENTTERTTAIRLALMQEGEAKIEAVRLESLRKIAAAEKDGSLTAEQAALSRQQAEQVAANARADLAERDARAAAAVKIAIATDEESKIKLIRDEAILQAQAGYQRGTLTAAEEAAKRVEAERAAQDKINQLKQRRDSAQVQTLQIQASMPDATGADKIALIKAQADLEFQAIEEARARDLAGAQVYADQRKAIEEKLAADIASVKQAEQLAIISSSEQAFGAVAGILKTAGKEQSAAYKVMFAASKAFAIAESIVKIQQGIAAAAALPFPANIPAMAGVVAATAGIIGTIQGAQYGGGRLYGGPVSDDKMYRVNENGRPEMFTASNGQQYMLPNARGEVTPANELGGGKVQISVQITNNHSGAAVSVKQDDSGRVVQIAINEVASQISNNAGPVWQAMRGSTNIEGRI